MPGGPSWEPAGCQRAVSLWGKGCSGAADKTPPPPHGPQGGAFNWGLLESACRRGSEQSSFAMYSVKKKILMLKIFFLLKKYSGAFSATVQNN